MGNVMEVFTFRCMCYVR